MCQFDRFTSAAALCFMLLVCAPGFKDEQGSDLNYCHTQTGGETGPWYTGGRKRESEGKNTLTKEKEQESRWWGGGGGGGVVV